jgi:hypothetical protein
MTTRLNLVPRWRVSGAIPPLWLYAFMVCTGRTLHVTKNRCAIGIIFATYTLMAGHGVAQWLRHCATNWKVAGSIPDGVIRIFHLNNPSGRTMALGSTQPLTKMSKGNGHPITGHQQPRGGVEVYLYSFSTLALAGGWWSAPCPGCFTPGKEPVPIVQEAGWALAPVWTCAKNLTPTGIWSPDRPAHNQSL